MADEPERLSFGVSTENLNAAIEILRQTGGLSVYPDAYQALVLERSRREVFAPPHEISLTRESFESLPPTVRELITRAQ
jgi:hypothetical protein